MKMVRMWAMDSDLESFVESDPEEQADEEKEAKGDYEKAVDSDGSDDFVDMDRCHYYPEDQVNLQDIFRPLEDHELDPLRKDFKTFDFELEDDYAVQDTPQAPMAMVLYLKYEIGHVYHNDKLWTLYVQGRKGQAINNIVKSVTFTINNKNTKVLK